MRDAAGALRGIRSRRIPRASGTVGTVSYTHLIILDESLLDITKKYRPVVYITKTKDNLYKVAKQYFNMSFDQLMTRNHLNTPNLKVNQKLVIGWFDNLKNTEVISDTKPNTLKSEQAKLEEKFTTANPAPFTEEYKAIDLVTSEWVKKYGKEENNPDYLIDLNKNITEIKIVERKNEKKMCIRDRSNLV